MASVLTVRKLSWRHRPIGTSRRELGHRECLLLEFRDGSLCVSSEASPLSGFGEDSLEVAQAELEAIHPEQVEAAYQLALESISLVHRSSELARNPTPLEAATALAAKCSSPSARFCLEALVLSAAAQVAQISMFEALGLPPVATELLTSVVVDPLALGYLDVVKEAYRAGVRTFKVKCGRDEVAELSVLRDIISATNGDVRLRVDANAAWSEGQAGRFVRATQDMPIEWFEDPTAEPESWPSVLGDADQLCAIDEPLWSRQPWQLPTTFRGALILKPMALGGFAPCLAWARWAHERGLRVCVSHFFDGPWAMEAYIALAFCIQSPEVATGLGQHPALDVAGAPRPRHLLPARILLPDPSSNCGKSDVP